jgi:transposase
MLVLEQAVEIRVLRRQGKSIREIARMLEMSRNTNYASYYNQVRTHLSLHKNAPHFRCPQKLGHIASIPILGRLHHQYVRV